ncbi:MAG: hypothetical protein DRJ40_05180 [Thermoprotei archaeon]|nr:MAG: hypothetical protein DRJ40_04345 [Thermoprotei archaeon]RLE56790.1 MAG: hypothetical protein DRJ40_05180 [Thermoprotei archaeon]
MVENSSCPYYCETRDGRRCIFLSPEEWRIRHEKLLNYCRNGGKGCCILARVLPLLDSFRRYGAGNQNTLVESIC